MLESSGIDVNSRSKYSYNRAKHRLGYYLGRNTGRPPQPVEQSKITGTTPKELNYIKYLLEMGGQIMMHQVVEVK